ncbi:hypothetical protein V6R21_09395 [Limibacter armeniacum]|uniref:hypothetical protein n=1 Tax=Limibacter armeniacum TaxID=466084 RepID=UPI002FE52059
MIEELIPDKINLNEISSVEDIALLKLLFNLNTKEIASEVEMTEDNEIILASVRKKNKIRKYYYDQRMDFGSWMILTHKKQGTHFFDGVNLFKFDMDNYYIKIQEQEALAQYFTDKQLYMKPVSKKWLGIYHENKLLATLQLQGKYSFAVIGNNILTITSLQKTYGLSLKDEAFVITTYEGGILKEKEKKAESLALN